MISTDRCPIPSPRHVLTEEPAVKRAAGLKWLLLFCLAGLSNAGILPAERTTVWNPGLNAAGGIPVRNTIHRTLLPCGGDDTPAIQEALDSCPKDHVVLLGPGDFLISSEGLIMNRSHVTLRGSGPDRTRLLKDTEVNYYPVVHLGKRWSSDKFLSASLDLAADGLKGSRDVTLNRVPDPPLAAGEIVLLDQLTNPDWTEWSLDSPPGHDSRAWFCRMDRPVSQIVEVESADGDRVTFTTPMHIDFLASFSAQISRFGEDWMGPEPVPATRWSGVEDLYLENGSDGNIFLAACAYCWVRNVESAHTEGSSIALSGCFRCEIRDSYIHTSDNPNPGGGGYLLSIERGSADNLVENNAVWNGNKVMVMRCSGGGNVIGYNYFEDAWIEYQPGWVESGANASHMTTPHMELFEGNQAFNFDGESTWGNSILITVFRNHFTGRRRSIPPLALTDEGFQRSVSLHHGHWWYSFIGNVLGEPVMDPSPYSAFAYETFYPWNGDTVGLWRLGVGTDWGPADPQVVSTVIRHGNFDYVTNRVIWDPAIPDRDIPNSLYLERKPGFFEAQAWPWVQPEAELRLFALPARERFDRIHGLLPSDASLESNGPVNGPELSVLPNPFNLRTEIVFRIQAPGCTAPDFTARLSVYSIAGSLVAVPAAGPLEPGLHAVSWDATGLPAGIYVARLEAGGLHAAEKMILVK